MVMGGGGRRQWESGGKRGGGDREWERVGRASWEKGRARNVGIRERKAGVGGVCGEWAGEHAVWRYLENRIGCPE